MSAPLVELPLHLWWSGPRQFDLADPQDVRRVYELVLREGTAEDVRRYIRRDVLVDILDDLVLPQHVSLLWRAALERP